MTKFMGSVFIGFLLGIGYLGPVFADELKSLYESEVILKSEENLTAITPETMLDAEKVKEITMTPQQQAFEALLLKLSVSESVLKNPLILKALADPDRYIKEESYHQTPSGERMLRIRFNEKSVNDLLNQAKIGLIGKNRPVLLIWLVLEQPEGPVFIDPESDALMIDTLKKVFKERAIPFVMPLFDLDDHRNLQSTGIQNQEFDNIRKASERYHPEGILIGRLKKTAPIENAATEWEAKWTLLKPNSLVDAMPSNNNPIDTSENNLFWINKNAVLELLFLDTAQRLGSVYKESAKLPTKSEPPVVMRVLSVQISGISEAEDYSKILEKLQKNSLIDSINIQQIGPDYNVFEIKTAASMTQLRRLFTETYQWIPDPSIVDSEHKLFYKIESTH